MNIKLAKALKLITIFTLIVSLTMSMTGCGTFQQIGQPTETAPTTTEPADPNAIVISNGGYFEGVRYYNELPTINHRTEEEIATTGLTAQDVLNAYDQLVTDISKAYYSDSAYSFAPQEIRESVVAKFDSISTYQYSFWNPNTSSNEIVVCPFYAFHPNYFPGVNFGAYYSSSIPEIPAYVITLSMKCYIDGVIADKFFTVGVEENQFEQTMIAFGQKSYFLDRETYREKVKGLDDEGDTAYYAFLHFLEQDVYEPMKITRETIVNATPEQLKAIYTMISSIRSIGFEYKLP